MRFRNREEAGRRLAAELERFAGDDLVVLGLPRGGVPVAYWVAEALDAPLDVIVVRKLGVPFQPELAMGAIGEGGARVINTMVTEAAAVSDEDIAEVEARELAELEHRVHEFRRGRPRVDLTGKTAVIVDDGIATGSTAKAACPVARQLGAARVVLAAPVAPVEAEQRLADSADELVVVATPEPFFGVGQFYDDFGQTPDHEVVELLDRAATRTTPRLHHGEIEIPCGDVALAGYIEVPTHASCIVVFAHGSGSSRHSSRNRYVASVLNHAGIGTLLFDLLTEAEAHDRANVFDIALLGSRLSDVREWLRSEPSLAPLRVGYFGASTGAAAALVAAARPGADVDAVVSRGGRPDLAGAALDTVTAPTRLIVGGDDTAVLELNREAQRHLRCVNDLVIIPGATHLFEEPGTLDLAARSALEWFQLHASDA